MRDLIKPKPTCQNQYVINMSRPSGKSAQWREEVISYRKNAGGDYRCKHLWRRWTNSASLCNQDGVKRHVFSPYVLFIEHPLCSCWKMSRRATYLLLEHLSLGEKKKTCIEFYIEHVKLPNKQRIWEFEAAMQQFLLYKCIVANLTLFICKPLGLI